MPTRAGAYMGIGSPMATSPLATPSAPQQPMRAGTGDAGECVVFDSALPDGTRVDVLQPGAEQPCHLPGKGFHRAALVARGALAYVPCVRLVTDGGAIWRGSRTTPFTFVDASADLAEGEWAYAPDMLDQRVFVRTRFGDVEQTVIEVQDIGDQWVVPLDFGGCSFAAGDTPDALVYSHNIAKFRMSNVNANVQGLGPWGSAMTPLTGTIGSSAVNAYAPSQNSYTPTGGYLGSGSYAGMGQGLAAANGTQAPPAQSPSSYGVPGIPTQGGASPWWQGAFAGGANIGGSSYGAPAPPQGQPQQQQAPPHLGFWRSVVERGLPGRQYNRQTGQFNGGWSIARGIGQIATGVPIATGWDLFHRTQGNP